jgi:predicted aspartyl protease
MRNALTYLRLMLYGAVVMASMAQATLAATDLTQVRWPEGTQVLPFENLEGAVLLRATLSSLAAPDTSGPMLVDTGAGYLALDLALSRLLGLADSASGAAAVGVASRPLRRLQLGGLQMDQVSPVLTVDAGIIRRVTGRPVLGLIGQSVLRGRVVVLDYAAGTLVLLPTDPDSTGAPAALRLALSPGAVAVPFHLVADGKAMLRVRVEAAPGSRESELSLVVDTGATKTIFFGAALDRSLPGWRSWPAVRGLGAPTLTGDTEAEMVRVPRLELGPAGAAIARSWVDAAVLGGDLPGQLEAAIGEPVDGLLGYSFLKHFRVALDYSRRVLWLDPKQGDVPDRPEEYCHPGIQLESVGGTLRVVAVAVGSPAARAGIRSGDELVSVDGLPVVGRDVIEVSRRLEGDPGSRVLLGLRRGPREWSRWVTRTSLF